ncbi:hypothetical protein WDW89_20960 [Deltaproteobacteria bacterium TL4]
MESTPTSQIKNSSSNVKPSSCYLTAKFNPAMTDCIPDLGDFYANELKFRREEIKTHSSGLINSAGRLFQSILGTKADTSSQKSARVSGLEIAAFTKQNMVALTKHLEKKTLTHAKRLLLVSQVSKTSGQYNLTQMRKLLMQASIPPCLGYYNVANIRTIQELYGLYLDQLQKRMTQELEKCDTAMMRLADEAKDVTPYKKLRVRLKRNLDLIEKTIKGLPAKLKEKDKGDLSLTMEKLNQAVDGTISLISKNLEQTRKDLEDKLVHLIRAMAVLPFLHFELFELARFSANLV